MIDKNKMKLLNQFESFFSSNIQLLGCRHKENEIFYKKKIVTVTEYFGVQGLSKVPSVMTDHAM